MLKSSTTPRVVSQFVLWCQTAVPRHLCGWTPHQVLILKTGAASTKQSQDHHIFRGLKFREIKILTVKHATSLQLPLILHCFSPLLLSTLCFHSSGDVSPGARTAKTSGCLEHLALMEKRFCEDWSWDDYRCGSRKLQEGCRLTTGVLAEVNADKLGSSRAADSV